MKQPKDFSPPRIYWSTVSMVMIVVLLVLSAIAGGAYGIILAIKSMAWHG